MGTLVCHSFQLLNCSRILIAFCIRTTHAHIIFIRKCEGRAESHGLVVTVLLHIWDFPGSIVGPLRFRVCFVISFRQVLLQYLT